jgi:acyl-coenzyme A synthetase/AMP-(fatty) acid ligase
MAFVVLQEGIKPDVETAHALQDYVKEHKARYKYLTRGVQFLPEILKSAAGKILHWLLRDCVMNDKKGVSRL